MNFNTAKTVDEIASELFNLSEANRVMGLMIKELREEVRKLNLTSIEFCDDLRTHTDSIKELYELFDTDTEDSSTSGMRGQKRGIDDVLDDENDENDE